MKKYTHYEKKKRIKNLKSWIKPIEARIYRLENIGEIVPKEIKQLNSEIEKERLKVLEFYRLYSEVEMPTTFNGQFIEQNKFLTIVEAELYINSVLYQLYDYLKSGNTFINALLNRTTLKIEEMEDHVEEVLNLKLKLNKHKKNLEKIQTIKATTQIKIENNFKTKDDHYLLIRNTEDKLNKKLETLRRHLYQLNNIRRYSPIGKQLRDGSYVNDNYGKDSYVLLQYKTRILKVTSLVNKRKIRKWVYANIKDIRIIKKKLKQLQKDFDEYVLETGSAGEKEIRYFLIKNNIIFEEQKRFRTCIDKKMLPFDFYIPAHKILIEFDGAQHFFPVDIFGGESGLIDRKRKDKIKTNWAKEHQFNLVRIRYDVNLQDVLNNLKFL